jgi:transcriptional regulator with XRE-family HTH domain
MAAVSSRAKASTSRPNLQRLFAANVMRLRKRAGLSQTALAKKVNLSLSYVSMLERGLRQPTFETVDTFALAFGLEDPRAMFRGR